MLLSLDRESTEPLYMQIKKQLKKMIEDGTLPAGYCLPPERKLAESLGVNRTTILNAYRDLKAEGFLSSHVGQGTVVCRPAAPSEPEGSAPLPFSWRQIYSQCMHSYDRTTTMDLLAVAGQKDMISFAAGIAIPGLNPLHELEDIWQNLIEQQGSKIFQHVPAEGLPSLRQSVCTLSGSRGIHATEQETMILSGSQQGLDFLARMLINPGDPVIMEEPSFFCARQIFESYGARVIGIPMDENGMQISLLESVLRRQKPKFIYTIPTFHNPTGTVMSLQNRQDLLRLAYRYHVAILEDDAYGELRYEGTPVPPIKALDRHGYVIYLSTFSKLLFMGFRVGWVHAPAQAIHKLASIKQLSDLHTNSIGQFVLDAFLRSSAFSPYRQRVLTENRKRRDIMNQALLTYAPPGIPIEWKLPEGGLYFWLKLPPQIPINRFYDAAVREGVVFVPGSVFCLEDTASKHIRLNFTYPDSHFIPIGIEKMMNALADLYNPLEMHSQSPANFAPIL